MPSALSRGPRICARVCERIPRLERETGCGPAQLGDWLSAAEKRQPDEKYTDVRAPGSLHATAMGSCEGIAIGSEDFRPEASANKREDTRALATRWNLIESAQVVKFTWNLA